jgi:hydroxyacylglutathione hydrolase
MEASHHKALTFAHTAADGLVGCGRFFEGSAEEMHTALNKTLVSVPDDTKVYVGNLSSAI